MEHRKPAGPVKGLILATAVVIVGLILWWASGGQSWWELFSDRERLRQTVSGAGALAPAVFVLLLVVQAALSRALGRGFVERSTRLGGFDRYVRAHRAAAIFVLRLTPLISFDATSYAAGLTGISFWRFLFATALGMAPGTFVFVYLGGTQPGPGVYAALGGLAALAGAAYVYHHRLQEAEGR